MINQPTENARMDLAVAVDQSQVATLLGAFANVFDPRVSEWEVERPPYGFITLWPG